MPDETKVIEQPHSCKIAINAKGQWSGEVKVYDEEPADALGLATSLAKTLAALIKEKNNSESGGK